MNSTQLKPTKRGPVLYLIGAFLMLFGALFGSVGVYVYELERKYIADGESVEGTIAGKNIEERWSTDSSTKKQKKTTYYYVRYKFTPIGGQEIESSSSVSSDVYVDAKEGSSIEIQYLRSDPSTNRIAQEPNYVLGAVFTVIGVLLLGIGLAFIGYELRKRRFARRLNQSGLVVDATIQSVGPSNLRINGVQQWRIEFSYVDFQGHTHRGNSGHLSPSSAEKWNIGDKGKVLYDKSDPAQHLWVE